jgi:hypothetical protein
MKTELYFPGFLIVQGFRPHSIPVLLPSKDGDGQGPWLVPRVGMGMVSRAQVRRHLAAQGMDAPLNSVKIADAIELQS